MPTSLHPQAKFDPIPPDLDLHALVDRTSNFEWVLRVTAHQIRTLGVHEFEKLVVIHVINSGRPLVIEKWNGGLPRQLFSAEWLERAHDKKQENVWDIGAQSNIPMTTGHYLRSMRQLANQWTPTNFRDDRRQRLYLKDIDCPVEWHDHLRKLLPRNLFYLNDNVENKGRPAADDMFVDEHAPAPAPAGDLMSSLPEQMRAENLMCYIGHEGTYTPAHREMCASLGQNIMVEASSDENGEKAGSSIWFMTETKDREVVREYFLSMLGHDVEIEKHFAQINAWKKARFPVYVVEQKPGDLILIPPLAPHQVWNRGTRTMKVAWNRTTVETLDLALHEALPKARLVCRDEQYKNKAIIYYTLGKYYSDIRKWEENTDLAVLGLGEDLMKDSLRTRQLSSDFKRLFKLFTEILVDEMFASKEKDVEFIEFDSNITCSYCRANIFNRFLTCKHCVRQLINGDEDTYDICMECYAMGRSCLCISGLSWCEQWSWAELVDNYEAWRAMVIKYDGYVDLAVSPLPLEIERKRAGKKSVAQICQEQLRRRPFKDITKPEVKSDLEPEEPEVDENGMIKKKKKKKSKTKKGEVYRCHVCCKKDNTYKLAFCSNPGCSEAYCFGVLYRGFDMMPQAITEQEKFKCPKCMKICNCAACRRSGNTNPYVPKNTLLGHDTRKIADDRSVESLVDFRLHNLGWLKKVGEQGRSQHSQRMQRLRDQADAEKAKDGDLRQSVGQPTLGAGAGPEEDDSVPQPITNDHGDRGHTLGDEAAGADHDGATLPAAAPTSQAGMGELPDEVTDMDLSQDRLDSTYPDPSTMARERMLGLAYYERDDSPDRILFDDYEQPSPGALTTDDEQSEFLKKTLRAAKRRARLDDDNDPDFLAPKSHHRKRPRLDKDDAEHNANVDPTLLGIDLEMEHTQASGSGSSGQPDVSTDAEAATQANIPSLRHVKPRSSYLEIEADGWEFNELVPAKESSSISAEQQDRDPLDVAADAIRSLAGGKPNTPRPVSTPKKRGPGRPRRSEAGLSGLLSGPSNKTDSPQSEPSKRRGRPPRASILAEAGADAPTVVPRGSDKDEVDDVADLEAQLEVELAGEADTAGEANSQARKRGRPPKRSLGTPSSATPMTGKRSAPAPSSAPEPRDGRFLSLAERMAQRGKKFKMGRSKANGSPSVKKTNPGPGPRQDAQDAKGNGETATAKAVGGPSSREAMSATGPKAKATGKVHLRRASGLNLKRAGPTVVRLGGSDDGNGDSSSSGGNNESGSEFDEDDEDIPAIPRSRGRPAAIRGGSRLGRSGRI